MLTLRYSPLSVMCLFMVTSSCSVNAPPTPNILWNSEPDSQPELKSPTATVGRYSRSTTAPTFTQTYPLAAIMTARFSRDRIATVGDAAREVLRDSGYQLIRAPDADARRLLQKPLPKAHRELGPMPLANILKTLAGPPYAVMVNDVNREVCIELKPQRSPAQMTPITPTPRLSRVEFERSRPWRRTAALQRPKSLKQERATPRRLGYARY